MTTILGEKLDLIRPRLIKGSGVRKADLLNPSYNIRPRLNKENSGEVASVCVQLLSGGIRAIPKGTHVDVISTFGIDPDNVEKTGWKLKNGRFVWR